jgi:adenylate kinase
LEAEIIMRIVLLGAPGSGKGTQAAILCKKLSVPHVSTGDLLRSQVKAGTELGIQAKQVMDRGELVSDEIVLSMLRERLLKDDATKGFILDGYPRNLAQAQALDELLSELGQPVDEAIQIDIEAEVIVARIAKRAELEGRTDDSAQTVRTRLDVYEQQTAPVVDYYAREGKLSQVYGVGTVEEISERILGLFNQANGESA